MISLPRYEASEEQGNADLCKPWASVFGKASLDAVYNLDDLSSIHPDEFLPASYVTGGMRILLTLEAPPSGGTFLYIKGVEIYAHGEYRDGAYQEFARGFGIRDYRGFLGSCTANQTRLKTPGELKGRDLSGEGFAGSLLRQILFTVYKTAEEEDPRLGLDYLKQAVPNYWDRRQTIIAMLNYLSQKPSVAMAHWKKDVEAAHLRLGAVEGDGV